MNIASHAFSALTFRKTSAALAAAALSLSFSAAASAEPAGEFARGRILIEARAGLSDADLDQLIKAHGGKRRKLGQSRMHIVDLPPGLSEEEAVARLSRRPELKFAELDRKVELAMAVNDPYIGSAWHINKIGAPTAWDSTQGGGVTIAVLDTGVNASHPDLKERLVPGYNVYNNNTDTSDLCGHGTAVAGTAAASTNNAIGVAGVAGSARIMPVRIAYKDGTGCPAYFSTIANGITYAADHGARVANVSYTGIAASSSVKSAARYMKSKGGLVFISAGNANVNENVTPDTAYIIVSSTTSSDTKSSFSSWGSFVSLAAPGSGIWTTNNSLGYSSWNGTSFSSPVSAGVAALMMAARPDLSGEQIEALLFKTAVDLGAAGRDPVFGHGRVNAAAAVSAARAYASAVDATLPVAAISAPLDSSSVSGLVPVSVNASDNVGVARVDLKVNGTVVATDSAAPYSFSWNSAGVANGMASLVAVAYDAAGNAGSSAAVSVNVANGTTVVAQDTTAPALSVDNPTTGTVAGTVSVSVSASDNSGAAGIRHSLAIDGAVVASGSGSALSYSWNTRKIAKGTHTISATARDAAGNTSTRSVSVSVR
ncbi:S8 family serine peptidase [Massilia sp. Dwa41.01b]|uniref:S8 family serine peptidase n=1 Tax=unclassified Massilia TaxID=2609279 RepID=UPI0015FFE212|nr:MULTISPECIES: S8 family serine peptidase [unclassified Massilia]QNA88914.1 S8 family serine peptidase [Massilia sp. Dwa41.01b]QNA99805.1 S8 family serine peptidase [Massilia sp. Se16.2.3]